VKSGDIRTPFFTINLKPEALAGSPGSAYIGSISQEQPRAAFFMSVCCDGRGNQPCHEKRCLVLHKKTLL